MNDSHDVCGNTKSPYYALDCLIQKALVPDAWCTVMRLCLSDVLRSRGIDSLLRLADQLMRLPYFNRDMGKF